MLENYSIDKNGVIFQVNVTENINYKREYVENSYEKYGELTNYISYLRYGYLIGSIGKLPYSLLDFGYGNGAFLNVCKEKISKCYGYDIGEFDVPKGTERIMKFNELYIKHFDVISFFDSLEHVENIYFLDKLDCDYIIISVPEYHDFSDEWFKNWKHRRMNEHLWHFSVQGLINFMRSQGYVPINISNIEDIIRKSEYNYSNILTGVFKKVK
jgi:hypothetical protein